MILSFILSGSEDMAEEQLFKLDIVSVRLVKEASLLSDTRLQTPEAVVDFMGKKLAEMDREAVCVINVDVKNRPINCHIVSMGALDYVMVSPRELFKASILSNAASILLIHNHPSGDIEPSKQDLLITKRIKEVADLIGISLLDHIIVGWNNPNYFSFLAERLMEKDKIMAATQCAECERTYAPVQRMSR